MCWWGIAAARTALLGLGLLSGLACRGPNPAFDPPAALPGGSDAGSEAAGPPDAQAESSPSAPDADPVLGSDAGIDLGPSPPDAELDAPADVLAPPPDLGQPAPADSASPVEAVPDLPTADVAAPAEFCPADPDLVLCLPFEGQAKDESPNHLVVNSSGVSFAPVMPPDSGQAGALTPSSRIEIPYNKTLDLAAVTIEASVRPRRLPTGNERMGVVDYTREYALFIHPGGMVRCTVVSDDDVINLDLSGAVQAQVWTHVACTVVDRRMTLWVNGTSKISGELLDEPIETGTGADTMVIGGNFSSTEPDPFDGLIDNVRIWRVARSRAQICSGGRHCDRRD